MGNLSSTGYTNDNATPPVNHDPSEGGGRVRMYYDTYLQGAADATIGDVILMKNLPGNARILPGGLLSWGAGKAGETLSVGITGTADKFVGATAAEVASTVALNAHLASGGTYKTPAAGVGVIVTSAVAAIKAAQRITVHIPYVID